MRKKKNQVYLDSQERNILLDGLVKVKNKHIQRGRYTDYVDELSLRS